MEQIRTLLWLKGRLTLARYRRKRGAFPPIVSLLLALPFGIAISLGLYFVGLVVFWGLPQENARQLLNGALTALYAMWLLGPLLGVALNESYDLSNLLHFPVPPRRLFLASILGAFMDPSVLFLLPPLAAIPIGLAHNFGTGLLMAAVALVFVFHTLSLSQALLTLLWGLLRSRRVRDFWKVAAGVAGTVFWLTYQVAIRRMGRVMPTLVLAKPGRFTRFLPSGMTADAVMALRAGDSAGYAWRLVVLLAICAATVALAGILVQRISTGDLVLDQVGQHPQESGQTAEAHSAFRITARRPGLDAACHRSDVSERNADVGARPTGEGRAAPTMRLAAHLARYPVFGEPRNRPDGNAAARGMAVPHSGGYLRVLAAGNGLQHPGAGPQRPEPPVHHARAAHFHLPRQKRRASHHFFAPEPAYVRRYRGLYTPVGLAGPRLPDDGKHDPAHAGRGQCVLRVYAVSAAGGAQEPLHEPRRLFVSGCLGTVAGFVAFLILAVPVVLAFLAPLLWLGRPWLILTVPLSAVYSVVVYGFITSWAARALVGREPDVLATILKTPA